MIEIHVPSIFYAEITYTLDVLLKEFSNIETKYTHSDDQTCYKFLFNKREIKIDNLFFYGNPSNLYLEDKLPNEASHQVINIESWSYPFIHMYGYADLQIESTNLHLKSDLIASAFFMLSRWEETVTNKKDKHNRFNGHHAISVKKGFYGRPIVNEYAQILISLLQHIGFQPPRATKKATLLLSHDIDIVKRWKNLGSLAKTFWNQPSSFLNNTKSFIASKSNIVNDPYFNFDKMLLIADQYNLGAIYYFGASESSNEYDHFDYKIEDQEIKLAIKKIISAGHKIGLHPSYYSFNDSSLLAKEKFALEKVIDENVIYNRQHYLRYDIETTPNILEELRFEKDSSLLYSFGPGFRTGSCKVHSMFDFKNRKMTSLKQQPLIFMDSHLLHLSNKALLDIFSPICDEVIKHGGDFTLLWHNNNLVPKESFEKLIALLNYFNTNNN